MRSLYSLFDNVCRSYQQDERSIDRLIELVQGDFDIFSERLFGDEGVGAGELLDDIMASGWRKDSGEDPIRAAGYYSQNRYSQSDAWLEFCDKIKADPEASPALTEVFGEDIDRAALTLPVGTLVWRARTGFQTGDNGERRAHAGTEIGAPPSTKAENARTSKKGQVVFYAAEDEQTAIGETRPAHGEFVSVGTFRALRALRIVDLSGRPPALNPFTEPSPAYFLEFYELLGTFGDQLAKPLDWSDDQQDYVPCQKLAEIIRGERYDGIRYPSAMRPEGVNVVLFEPAVVAFETSKLVRVTGVKVMYE